MSAVLNREEARCKWFAMCANCAVTTLPHPILKMVPVCDRCLHMTMRRTEFDDYEGLFNMPVIIYKLIADHNKGLDDIYHFEEPFHASEAWDIPMGDLLCIEGVWNEMDVTDQTTPYWAAFGIDSDALGDKSGVYYADAYMVIRGYNGQCAVFWLFKKA